MFSCRDNPVTKLHPWEGLLLARNLKLDLFWMSKCNLSIWGKFNKGKERECYFVKFSYTKYLTQFRKLEYIQITVTHTVACSACRLDNKEVVFIWAHSVTVLGVGDWKLKLVLHLSKCIFRWRHPHQAQAILTGCSAHCLVLKNLEKELRPCS